MGCVHSIPDHLQELPVNHADRPLITCPDHQLLTFPQSMENEFADSLTLTFDRSRNFTSEFNGHLNVTRTSHSDSPIPIAAAGSSIELHSFTTISTPLLATKRLSSSNSNELCTAIPIPPQLDSAPEVLINHAGSSTARLATQIPNRYVGEDSAQRSSLHFPNLKEHTKVESIYSDMKQTNKLEIITLIDNCNNTDDRGIETNAARTVSTPMDSNAIRSQPPMIEEFSQKSDLRLSRLLDDKKTLPELHLQIEGINLRSSKPSPLIYNSYNAYNSFLQCRQSDAFWKHPPKVTVLLVECSKLSAPLRTLALRILNFEVTHVPSCEEAYFFLASFHYDIILIDSDFVDSSLQRLCEYVHFFEQHRMTLYYSVLADDHVDARSKPYPQTIILGFSQFEEDLERWRLLDSSAFILQTNLAAEPLLTAVNAAKQWAGHFISVSNDELRIYPMQSEHKLAITNSPANDNLILRQRLTSESLDNRNENKWNFDGGCFVNYRKDLERDSSTCGQSALTRKIRKVELPSC